MALDSAVKLTRRRDIAFALEATTGTAETIGNSTGTIPVFNPQMPYNTEIVAREANGRHSPVRQGRGARSGTLTFETEFYGNETGRLVDLFKCCGMTLATATLTPSSAAVQTATFGMYQDGQLKKLVGCMGTAVLRFRRGVAPRISWTFTGVQDQPSDTTLITPTKVTTISPRIHSSFTIGGSGGVYRMPELDFDLGNRVELREDLLAVDSAGEATGYRAAFIPDRNPRVTVAPEALALATRDWYDVFRDSTNVALSITCGTTDNGLTLAAPKMELAGDPTEADRAGQLVHNLQFSCLASSDAGDDEYSVVLLT